MNMFDELNAKFTADYSAWIKIVDDQSRWVIDDFPYVSRVDENITKPHCWRWLINVALKMKQARSLQK